MSKIIEISDKIKTKLDTIDTIETVMDTIEPVKDWFPCVQFEPLSMDSSVEDTCNNLRELKFEIVLTQEIETVPTQEWETKRRAGLTLLETSYWNITDVFDQAKLGPVRQHVQTPWGAFGRFVRSTRNARSWILSTCGFVMFAIL